MNLFDRLEYTELKKILDSYISTDAGKLKLEELAPNLPQEEILKRFKLIESIGEIIEGGSRLNFFDFPHIKKALDMAIQGASLPTIEIKKIGIFLTEYDKLYESLLGHLPQDILPSPEPLKVLKKKIHSTFEDDGELKEKASPLLYELRVKRRKLREEIYRTFEKLLLDYGRQGLLRDNIITLRNGRFVLPFASHVKPRGVVHGFSKTEETLYVEPFETVEIQNKYVKLIEEEREERERIVREVLELLWENAPLIKEIWEALGFIELIYALYRFKDEYNCVYPEFKEDKIVIKEGRHPVLVKNKGWDGVVPLDLELDKRALIISGPNAGGKTVLLKTVGIFHLMAKSGMPVPAVEAVLIRPNNIFAVGFEDEQNLLEGESSFTAVIREITDVINKVTKRDLVLMDELISSTDPQEASGLAFAVIKYILKKGGWVLGNTHLTLLKMLVSEDKEMLNGSMLFDPLTKKPTYKLRIGEIGVSHAFDIALDAGLSQEIVEEARRYVQGKENHLERLISDLQHKESLLERLINEYEEKLAYIKEKERKAEKIAKERAQKIILQAREEVTELIKQLEKEVRKEKKLKMAKAVRKTLQEKTKEYDIFATPAKEFIPGRVYRIKPIGILATLQEVKDKKAIIKVGLREMEVPTSSLYEVE